MGRGQHTESSATARTEPIQVDSIERSDFTAMYLGSGGAHNFVYGKGN